MIDPETQALIDAVAAADSASSLVQAVRHLAEARSPAAIPTLIAALGYNNPGAAVASVDGLVALGEPAVEPLLQHLDGYNYGARAWAIRSLALIGDPRALETLLKAGETDFALSVRRAAAKGLGNLQWQQIPEGDRTPVQARVFESLCVISRDPEWVVRYASIVGLQSLGSAVASNPPAWFPRLQERLGAIASEDEEPGIRARAHLALSVLAEFARSPLPNPAG